MSKTIFIIAGFKHSASEKQYNWMRKFFKSKGFIVKIPDIQWTNCVMTDYVNQFKSYYSAHKTETNYVLGFSYGAMTALISAQEIKPDKLYLCSLSPYFSEDLGTLKKSWEKSIGCNRINDFEKYSANKLAEEIHIPTTIFYGVDEGKKYPQLKIRCEDINTNVNDSKLVVVEDAPHRIDYLTYVEAITAEFE